jgi:hypothetical protein
MTNVRAGVVRNLSGAVLIKPSLAFRFLADYYDTVLFLPLGLCPRLPCALSSDG